MPRIYDISLPVAPGIRVWPGDHPYQCDWTSRMADGASCNVGQVAMSCHTGTHIDAPYHLAPGGATVEATALEACVGPAVVMALAQLAEARAERVLVRAGGAAPSPAALERLGPLRLFGTDSPSVDAMESKTLDIHHALWRRGTVILEGLDLSAVPDGEYQLIALPIKLVGMDAAPVRAILIAP
jgi:arylformamidase